jgi:hypothetical protein
MGKIQGGSMDGKFVALHLDFSSVWIRECQYSQDDLLSDYEAWSYLNGTCSFGEKVFT